MKKYSNEDLAAIIENEGLDYTILYYLSIDKIEDEEMKSLFLKAKEVLSEINSKLEPFLEQDL